MMAQQHRYAFPVMRTKDIEVSLNESDIQVTLQMLNEPTPEGMLAVYREFVDMFLGEHEVDNPTSLAHTEFPELFEESTRALDFIKQLVMIMRASGVDDFSPRELEYPDARQFRRALSALINFARFRNSRIDKFEELLQASSDLHDEKARCELELQAAEEQVRQLRAKLEKEAPEVQSLEEEAAAIASDIHEANNRQVQLRSETAELKGRRQELIEDIAAKNSETKAVELENARLQKQVVRDPEKVRKLIADLKATLATERAEIEKAERRTVEDQARLDELVRVEKEILKAQTLQEQVRAEMGRSSIAKKAVKQSKSKLSATKMTLQDYNQKEHTLERQTSAINEKGNRLRQKAEQKAEANAAMLEQAEQERSAVDRTRDETKIKVMENKRTCQQVQAEIQNVQSMYDENVGNLMRQFQLLDDTVREYHQGILGAIQNQ